MRKTGNPVSWVVYLMTMRGKATGMAAVCDQNEWDAMERAQPGHHTLIRSDIASEGEAEQLARNQPVHESPDRTPAPEQSPAVVIGIVESESEISIA
jgi:hypothetical protein